MTVPIRCQSYIFDSFSDACGVMEILNVRYPLALITAVTGRLLSVGIVAVEWDEGEIDTLVRDVHEEVRTSDRPVSFPSPMLRWQADR